jgi:hypothetical protein
MATSILKSIKGKVVRLTRLDDCGDPVVGSCSTLVSECFVSVTLSAEIEAGDEYLQKSAWGDLCINDKDPDIIKWVNVSINFAEINPDALDILTGADPIVSGGNTIGAAWAPVANDTAFSLEVWTKFTGEPCTGTPDWGYFVVPFIRNGRIDGDLTIENGVMTIGVVGQGFAATNWGASPYTPNPFIETFPTGNIFGMVVTDVQPPTDTAGCIPYTGS